MANPIRVQLTKASGDWPKGTELGFDSEAAASKSLGEGTYKVTGTIDGGVWAEPDAPAAATEPAAESTRVDYGPAKGKK